MATELPWEYHSDLTPERLSFVASLIADGRHAAVDLYDEELGDSGWTLGTRAFQFGRARILWAIDSGNHPWLTAIDRNLQLIFAVGEVPVRIYKGYADEPTNRTLRQTWSELRQLSFSLFDDEDRRDLAYRFAVETDLDGSVLAVKFVGLRGESAVLNWNVPIEAEVMRTGAVGRPATETVVLEPPVVDLPNDEKKKEEDEI